VDLSLPTFLWSLAAAAVVILTLTAAAVVLAVYEVSHLKRLQEITQ
jgi:hypothetical protein